MTRRRKRRERITKRIEFFLRIMRNGEWTENKAIVSHLESTTRGRKSYNALTVNSLGQYLRWIEGIERRELWRDGHARSTQYRLAPIEEGEE